LSALKHQIDVLSARLPASRLAGPAASPHFGLPTKPTLGTKLGYQEGFKVGRKAGFEQTYDKAYIRAYKKEFEEAGPAVPEKVKVP
jgi:hypothetical protein